MEQVKRRPFVYSKFKQLIRHGSECQVCLSEDEFEKDPLLECHLCNGKVHSSCYGITEAKEDDQEDEWFCQRCDILRMTGFQERVEKCFFCPNIEGAMRKIIFNKLPVWAHPQCFMRDYPLKQEKSKKQRDNKLPYYESLRISSDSIKKHWLMRPARTQKCKVCGSDYGETTKCKIPGCDYYFHIPCGAKVGVVREQSSMNVKMGEEFNFYIPFYCHKHLEERYQDYCEKIRSQKFKSRQTEIAFMAEKIRVQLERMKAAREKMVVEETFVYEPEESESSRSMLIYVDAPPNEQTNSLSTSVINYTHQLQVDFQTF